MIKLKNILSEIKIVNPNLDLKYFIKININKVMDNLGWVIEDSDENNNDGKGFIEFNDIKVEYSELNNKHVTFDEDTLNITGGIAFSWPKDVDENFRDEDGNVDEMVINGKKVKYIRFNW